MNKMWNLALDNYIFLAGFLALLSFIVLHQGSQKKAKITKNEIQASIDSTLIETKKELDTLLTGVEDSSAESIANIKKASDSIIIDLKKDSKSATKEIKMETTKIIAGLNNSYKKIKADTESLERKNQYSEVSLHINYEMKLKINEPFFYAKSVIECISHFLNEQRFSLNFREQNFNYQYLNSNDEFKLGTTYGSTLRSKQNLYFTDQQVYNISGGNPTFQLNFKFILEDNRSVEYPKELDFVNLLVGPQDTFSIPNPMPYEERILEILPGEYNAVLKFSNGRQVQLEFIGSQLTNAADSNEPIQYEFKVIK